MMQENTLSASTPTVSDEESAEVNANDQPEAPKQVLQYLFSLIRGEVEQLDSRALPLCLHQVLPTNPPRPTSPTVLGLGFGVTGKTILCHRFPPTCHWRESPGCDPGSVAGGNFSVWLLVATHWPSIIHL